MSTLHVIGVYSTDPAMRGAVAARQREIKAHCKREALTIPSFATPDFSEATVAAYDLAQDGHQVVLVGSIGDLHIPEGGVSLHPPGSFTEHEWREAWLAYLKERAIGWHPIDCATLPAQEVDSSRQSVIRSYQRACVAISRHLARARSKRKVGSRSREPGYVYGRPPYGYRVAGGHLSPDKRRMGLVKAAFGFLREGMSTTEAAKAMQTLKLKPRRAREYWDPVKIRRIIKHAPLYCLGEYISPSGDTIRLPSLAFLPESWADAPPARRPRPVPKQARSGTLGTLTPA